MSAVLDPHSDDSDRLEHRPDPAPPPARTSPWPWILLAIVLLPVLALAIFAVVTFGGAIQAWQTVDNLFAGRLVVRTDQPAVVLQVQQLNRLETASFTIEKIIEGGVDQGSPVLNAFLGDRLLFIAHGNVIAGVDLSQLKPEDVIVHDSQSISLRLPPARVLTQSLDNGMSRVYDRQRGLLTRGDPNLETQVRREADQQILKAACQGGILHQADTNAQTQVRALLGTDGLSPGRIPAGPLRIPAPGAPKADSSRTALSGGL